MSVTVNWKVRADPFGPTSGVVKTGCAEEEPESDTVGTPCLGPGVSDNGPVRIGRVRSVERDRCSLTHRTIRPASAVGAWFTFETLMITVSLAERPPLSVNGQLKGERFSTYADER